MLSSSYAALALKKRGCRSLEKRSSQIVVLKGNVRFDLYYKAFSTKGIS